MIARILQIVKLTIMHQNLRSTKKAKHARIPLFLCMAFISISACSQNQLVADIEAGKQKSAICGQCHGQNGIAIVPIYPNLAGQKQAYMELQLKAFRAGERINAAMTPHARKLTDQDIRDLSAYYSQLDASGNSNRKGE